MAYISSVRGENRVGTHLIIGRRGDRKLEKEKRENRLHPY